jgi:hypothetical protein
MDQLKDENMFEVFIFLCHSLPSFLLLPLTVFFVSPFLPFPFIGLMMIYQYVFIASGIVPAVEGSTGSVEVNLLFGIQVKHETIGAICMLTWSSATDSVRLTTKTAEDKTDQAEWLLSYLYKILRE